MRAKSFGRRVRAEKRSVYLLLTECLTLLTDLQALQYAFKKKNVHGRLARWLDFLPEYGLTISYKPRVTNFAADFLSRYDCREQAQQNGHDEGDLATIVFGEQCEMEPLLLAVHHYLSFKNFDRSNTSTINLLSNWREEFYIRMTYCSRRRHVDQKLWWIFN